MTFTITLKEVMFAVAAVPVSAVAYIILGNILFWTVGIVLPGTGPSRWGGW